MSRIEPILRENATGQVKELLDDVQSRMGMIPNIFWTLAHSPAVLEGYVRLRNALDGGLLPAKLREEIALAVSQANHSEYCLAGHTAIGKTLGLSDDEILDSRRGRSSDSKVEAALKFVTQVVEKHGWLSDEDLSRVREAGYGDREISEMIGCVCLAIFGDYFTQIAKPAVDFPPVPELAEVS